MRSAICWREETHVSLLRKRRRVSETYRGDRPYVVKGSKIGQIRGRTQKSCHLGGCQKEISLGTVARRTRHQQHQ